MPRRFAVGGAVSRFPSSDIDLALVVDDAPAADAVAEGLRAAAGEVLESVRLFDVYRGPGIAEGAAQPGLPPALLLPRSHADRRGGGHAAGPLHPRRERSSAPSCAEPWQAADSMPSRTDRSRRRTAGTWHVGAGGPAAPPTRACGRLARRSPCGRSQGLCPLRGAKPSPHRCRYRRRPARPRATAARSSAAGCWSSRSSTTSTAWKSSWRSIRTSPPRSRDGHRRAHGRARPWRPAPRHQLHREVPVDRADEHPSLHFAPKFGFRGDPAGQRPPTSPSRSIRPGSRAARGRGLAPADARTTARSPSRRHGPTSSLEDECELLRVMSTDEPSGDADKEEEVWTRAAARVRRAAAPTRGGQAAPRSRSTCRRAGIVAVTELLARRRCAAPGLAAHHHRAPRAPRPPSRPRRQARQPRLPCRTGA